MITLGEHRVRVTGEFGMGARDDGNNFVAIEVELLDGGDRIAYFGNFGDAVIWTDPSTGKSMTSTDFTMAALRAAGFKGDDISDMSSMVGFECTALIDADKNGKPRVKKFKSQGGVRLKTQLTPAEMKVFAAKTRAKIAASRVSSGEDAPKPEPAKNPADDIVPF